MTGVFKVAAPCASLPVEPALYRQTHRDTGLHAGVLGREDDLVPPRDPGSVLGTYHRVCNSLLHELLPGLGLVLGIDLVLTQDLLHINVLVERVERPLAPLKELALIAVPELV